ncbi:hypothetical protein Dimus_019344 [Dionaea muscipula]
MNRRKTTVARKLTELAARSEGAHVHGRSPEGRSPRSPSSSRGATARMPEEKSPRLAAPTFQVFAALLVLDARRFTIAGARWKLPAMRKLAGEGGMCPMLSHAKGNSPIITMHGTRWPMLAEKDPSPPAAAHPPPHAVCRSGARCSPFPRREGAGLRRSASCATKAGRESLGLRAARRLRAGRRCYAPSTSPSVSAMVAWSRLSVAACSQWWTAVGFPWKSRSVVLQWRLAIW